MVMRIVQIDGLGRIISPNRNVVRPHVEMNPEPLSASTASVSWQLADAPIEAALPSLRGNTCPTVEDGVILSA